MIAPTSAVSLGEKLNFLRSMRSANCARVSVSILLSSFLRRIGAGSAQVLPTAPALCSRLDYLGLRERNIRALEFRQPFRESSESAVELHVAVDALDLPRRDAANSPAFRVALDAGQAAPQTCAMLLSALVATLPAVLRALRTDPTEILRSE